MGSNPRWFKNQSMFAWKEGQKEFRALLKDFVASPENVERISRFKGDEEVFSLVLHFLGPYFNHVVPWKGRNVRINEMFRAAMNRLKKRFFDFSNKPGRHSELVWEGVRNPELEVVPGFSMCLPRAVALRWFILHDLDKVFWKDEAKIKSLYYEHKAKKKEFYSTNHKQKKKERRELMIKKVISMRKPEKTNKKKNKTILNRAERKFIFAGLQEQRLLERRLRKERRKTFGGRAGGNCNNSLQLPSADTVCAVLMKEN